jgi:hypothetical protein
MAEKEDGGAFAKADLYSAASSDDDEDEEEEKEKKQDAGPPPEQMRGIIMKQKASGSWDWSDAFGLVGLTSDKLRSGIPSAKLQTGTRPIPSAWQCGMEVLDKV